MKPFIETAGKTWLILLFLSLLIVFPLNAQPRVPGQKAQAFDTWDPVDEGMKTGPAVGENIPEFNAVDQNGKLLGYQDISGPNGAVILFHRSADW